MSNGGANGIVSAATFDGGQTWVRSSAKFSAAPSAYDRATDPWVSIGPAHRWQIAYVFDARAPNARCWSAAPLTEPDLAGPQQLQRDTDPICDGQGT